MSYKSLYPNKKKVPSVLRLLFLSLTICAIFALVFFLLKNSGSESSVPKRPYLGDIPVVMIDPGHGGNDPGCVYGGVWESTVNLSLALEVKNELTALGCEVIMTRDGVDSIQTSQKIELAASSGADILISIHQNSVPDDTVTSGIETFYNADTNVLSAALARCIQSALIEASGAKDRGIKPDNKLILIREIPIPSCLVETGFMSSDTERALLTDLNYQRKLAAAIASGIIKYFES